MQAVENETLILYHTDLSGRWPEEGARRLAGALPYARRLALRGPSERVRASLAGIALALRSLAHAAAVPVAARELCFPSGGKPRLAAGSEAHAAGCDFSIAHSGHLVGCAAVARGAVGFDLELGDTARLRTWVRREAALKAAGLPLARLREVQLLSGGARCGGRRWHARPLACLPGASACSMTSFAPRHLEARHVSLEELFAA